MYDNGKGDTPELEAACASQKTHFDSLAEEIFEEVQEWKNLPDEEWHLAKTAEGCQIYMRNYPGSSFKQMKATKVVETDASPSTFIRFMSNFMYNQYYREPYTREDPQNMYSLQVFAFNELFDITKLRIASPSFLIWPRDMCLVRKLRYESDKAYIYGQSVEFGVGSGAVDPENPFGAEPWPTDAQCVRCFLKFCSYAEALDNGRLRYTYFLHCDPSGWVPAWVYNLAMHKKGLTVPRYLRVFLDADEPTRKKILHNLPLDTAETEIQQLPSFYVHTGTTTTTPGGIEGEEAEEGEEEDENVEIIEEIVYVDEEGEEIEEEEGEEEIEEDVVEEEGDEEME